MFKELKMLENEPCVGRGFRQRTGSTKTLRQKYLGMFENNKEPV